MTSGVPTRDGDALSLETLSITDTQRYVDRGYPWAEWDLLRREAPVYWYDRPDVDPFWALTRYEDTLTISKRSDIFISSDRLRIFPSTQEEFSRRRKEELIARFGPERARRHYTLSFIDMDDPEHAAYRNLTNRSFTPRAMRLLEDHIAELAEAYVSGFARHLVNTVSEQGECDFVHDLAVKLPMAAIFEMLGFPREDWDELFGIREVQFGSDRELALSGLTPEELHEERQKANKAATEYGFAFIEARKAAGAPSDCLVDVLLRAELDGRTLEDDEINSYINLLVAGGLETTRNATTGGVLALMEHPEERDRLVASPELLRTAVEEILRWTSPVIQFARVATEDFELRGHTIRAGETVAMWYPSANRDEAAWDDPYRFDITRDPNDHLSFGGFGAHFCLGANLARWELRGIFKELLPLLPEMELDGPPFRQDSLHVGGIVKMPVRYRPVPAA
ncbi:MAG: cytochrome P450 [Chloroflexi bacterium]|nr:cytochrome P450 [Chloroflexota bacterium]